MRLRLRVDVGRGEGSPRSALHQAPRERIGRETGCLVPGLSPLEPLLSGRVVCRVAPGGRMGSRPTPDLRRAEHLRAARQPAGADRARGTFFALPGATTGPGTHPCIPSTGPAAASAHCDSAAAQRQGDGLGRHGRRDRWWAGSLPLQGVTAGRDRRLCASPVDEEGCYRQLGQVRLLPRAPTIRAARAHERRARALTRGLRHPMTLFSFSSGSPRRPLLLEASAARRREGQA